MEYAASGKIFEGMFNKDQKDGVGYYFNPNGRVYCGTFRNDNEEGVGEYLNEKDIENNFSRLDKKSVEIIKDKVYKICMQLAPLGVKYDCVKANITF